MLKLHHLTLKESSPPRTLGRYITIIHEDGRALVVSAETLDSHIMEYLGTYLPADPCCCTECPRDCPACAECKA